MSNKMTLGRSSSGYKGSHNSYGGTSNNYGGSSSGYDGTNINTLTVLVSITGLECTMNKEVLMEKAI